MKTLHAIVSFVALGLFVTCAPVFAGLIESDDVRVLFQGRIVADVSIPETPEGSSEGIVPIYTFVGVTLVDSTGYLTEPGTDELISDVFGIRANVLTFRSEELGNCHTAFPGFPGPCIVETGDFQDVTFAMPGVGAAGYQVLIRSEDVHVPEPASLALLGIGLLGLWRSRARIQRCRL